MTEQFVMDVGSKATWLAIQIAAPALVATMITGLVVSIFQAATQINEQTLAFIPKILMMTVAVVVCGHWILGKVIGFTTELIQGIPNFIG